MVSTSVIDPCFNLEILFHSHEEFLKIFSQLAITEQEFAIVSILFQK